MNAVEDRLVRKQQTTINKLFYEQVPALGMRNYWHPVASGRQIGRKKPLALTVMGDEVVIMRRNGKLFAVANECPHRGSRLSRGTCEFPGSNTVTCRYHGWTFDLEDGALMAALTDGPDSPILNKQIRVRTYPVEERKGIVWLWMASEEPVPVEEDIPPAMLAAEEVHIVQRHVRGNWRWHVENPGLGHATMLHRDSLYMRFVDMFGFGKNFSAPLMDEGNDGEWLQERMADFGRSAEFEGLGEWPVHRIGEVIPLAEMPPVQGVTTIVSVKVPGIIRITNFPIRNVMYYEWFVQTDEDHYLYFQTCCSYAKTLKEKISFWLRFFAWGRFVGMIRFNNQDLAMIEDSHDYAKRRGFNDPIPSYRPDQFQIAWRRYLLKFGRGFNFPEMDEMEVETAQPEAVVEPDKAEPSTASS